MEKEQNTTAEKIIQKIEQEKMVPIAGWHFTLRNNGFWALWIFSVILGACAVAATIFVFLNSGWVYRGLTHSSSLKFILDVVPFFWLLSIGSMIAFGYFNIRHTKKGYRLSFYLIVLASLVLSFIGGTFIYAVGLGRNIDNIRRPLPFSSPIMIEKENRWNNPNAGLLAGEVVFFDKEKNLLVIKLFSGKEKNISTEEVLEENLNLVEEGFQIRVIGSESIVESDVFIACAILPWDLNTFDMKRPVKPKSKDTVERKINKDRINTCEDVRPYKKYKEILITN